jgi:spore maturation protein A
MLNYIWFGLLAMGIIVGIMNGRVEAVSRAMVDSAKSAVDLSLGLLGIICLWTGLMAIAEKSGLVTRIAKIARPVMAMLFPDIPKKHPAIAAIVLNMAANFLGLGNAATPLGLKAMGEMQKLNLQKDTATNSMSMFLVLNTAAIQLIPATIIAVRAAAGSNSPTDIIVPIWITSVCASVAGIAAVKFFMGLHK